MDLITGSKAAISLGSPLFRRKPIDCGRNPYSFRFLFLLKFSHSKRFCFSCSSCGIVEGVIKRQIKTCNITETLGPYPDCCVPHENETPEYCGPVLPEPEVEKISANKIRRWKGRKKNRVSSRDRLRLKTNMVRKEERKTFFYPRSDSEIGRPFPEFPPDKKRIVTPTFILSPTVSFANGPAFYSLLPLPPFFYTSILYSSFPFRIPFEPSVIAKLRSHANNSTPYPIFLEFSFFPPL